jgi:hypothetical protein
VSRLGRASPPGKRSPVLIGQEAGWAPEPDWIQRLEEKCFASDADRNRFARSSSPLPDTILTELLSYCRTKEKDCDSNCDDL